MTRPIRIISLSDFDNVNNSDNFDEFFESIGYRFDESFGSGWEGGDEVTTDMRLVFEENRRC